MSISLFFCLLSFSANDGYQPFATGLPLKVSTEISLGDLNVSVIYPAIMHILLEQCGAQGDNDSSLFLCFCD